MSQPRYAEFIRLKTITDRWQSFEDINGNEDDNEIYNGGGPGG